MPMIETTLNSHILYPCVCELGKAKRAGGSMLPNASSEDCGWGSCYELRSVTQAWWCETWSWSVNQINVCLTRKCSCVYAVPWDTPSHMQGVLHIKSSEVVLTTMTVWGRKNVQNDLAKNVMMRSLQPKHGQWYSHSLKHKSTNTIYSTDAPLAH